MQLINAIKRLFNTYTGKHCHIWEYYTKVNPNHGYGGILFYCRKCTCGLHQIQDAGPMGDKTWQNVETKKFHFDFERKWFEEAVVIEPGKSYVDYV